GLGFPTDAMPYVHEATYDGEIQIYVPSGSERLSGSLKDSWTELERMVLEEWVTVPPEQRRAVTVTYRLPNRPVEGGRIVYQLGVRKQASSAAVPIHLTITGPEGWRAEGTNARE